MPASKPRISPISIAWTVNSLYNVHISMFMRSPRCIKRQKRICQNLAHFLAFVKSMNDQPAQPKLLDQLRHALRRKHYSYRTEQSYVRWVKRFILFHKERTGQYIHPRHMGPTEIEAFLQRRKGGKRKKRLALLASWRDAISSAPSPPGAHSTHAPPFPAQNMPLHDPDMTRALKSTPGGKRYPAGLSSTTLHR